MPEAEIFDIRTGRAVQSEQERDAQRDELVSLMRAMNDRQLHALSIVATGVAPQREKAKRAGGGDAALIRWCNRLVEVQAAIHVLYDYIHDDNERDRMLEPLDVEWKKLRGRLSEFQPPRTPAGARAVALAALSEQPDDLDDAARNGNVTCWLALACAHYLTGPRDPQRPPPAAA
jgi:hypothetical protein